MRRAAQYCLPNFLRQKGILISSKRFETCRAEVYGMLEQCHAEVYGMLKRVMLTLAEASDCGLQRMLRLFMLAHMTIRFLTAFRMTAHKRLRMTLNQNIQR